MDLDRRTFLRTTLGTAGALVLGSCAEDGSNRAQPGTTLSPTDQPAPRPTVRVAGGDFGFPSPFLYSRGPGYWRMSYLYDTLLWKDSTGQQLPWLASRYERSADGLSHTFEIRDSVRWHDGQPLTPDDVVFSFEYFTAAQRLAPQGQPLFVRPQGTAQAKGGRTVEIRLDTPSATFVPSVAGAIPIIPRHIWSSVEDPTKVTDPKILVGSGPYRLESYTRGEGAYLYTANDDYFLGRPFIRRIEMRPVTDELTAILAGEIDAGGPTVGGGAQPDALAPFKNDASFDILEGPGDFTLGLYWNLAKGGALADARFRQACCRAIDRNDIVKRLVGGEGKPGNPGFLPPTNPFHVRVEQYPFDLAAANRQLDDAGYPRSGTGGRQTPDGQPLRFPLLVGNDPVPPVADLVVNALKAVGVELSIEVVDRPTRDARTTSGDYQMAITNYGGLGGDPDYMRRLYASRAPKTFNSAQGYANPEFDRLAQEQLSTVDEAARKRIVGRMQEIAAADVPLLPLYYPDFFHVFKKAVFDQWYYTPGGFAGGVPTVYNKHAYITGLKTGLQIRPTK